MSAPGIHAITDNLAYLLIGAWPHGPIGGAVLTLVITLISAVLSAAIGMGFGIALSMATGLAQRALRLFLGFFRAIPILMLIFWIYFLGPMAFGLDVPGVASVVAALSLVTGAYLAHALHAGIAALPRGQWQAGAALGLSRVATLRRIILPQVLPRVAPSFVNQLVSLTKDSSLAYVIGVAELSFVTTQVSNRVIVHPLELYLFAAALYFVICLVIELGAGHWARRNRVPA